MSADFAAEFARHEFGRRDWGDGFADRPAGVKPPTAREAGLTGRNGRVRRDVIETAAALLEAAQLAATERGWR